VELVQNQKPKNRSTPRYPFSKAPLLAWNRITIQREIARRYWISRSL